MLILGINVDTIMVVNTGLKHKMMKLRILYGYHFGRALLNKFSAKLGRKCHEKLFHQSLYKSQVAAYEILLYHRKPFLELIFLIRVFFL